MLMLGDVHCENDRLDFNDVVGANGRSGRLGFSLHAMSDLKAYS